MPVVALENVSAGYGKTEILHNLNLHVDQDEIVVIIGPNGAGKSTAMKSVFGLLNISQGKVSLNNQNITNMPPEKVVRLGVALVPQVSNVFTSLSVEENLEMGAFILKGDFKPRRDDIYELFPDLHTKRKVVAGTLSGGQRQMLAMGKAMMSNPSIMLLDEPTAGLSPKYQNEILRIVKMICQSGIAVMMVEQNAKKALGVATRAYVLVDGQNKFEGTGQDLLNDDNVAQMFLGGK